ncbi:unnamed protein product [Rotaria sordida]|uniref:Uncharacterized protein n=1 Tax=Rotaria sordida TaxID=392033 RepID=A0A814ULV9_9BILA|nr:unnamed protein product [Rotaria sordida]CAF3889057.1 unnamed protein product [Rotaria sordida]
MGNKTKLDAVTLFENNQIVQKKGGKRKRLEGGAPADIRREKVTFRHLEKQDHRIAKELNHSIPSSSWYLRFMKCHGLSLQRPKRQDKVPLDEVHRLANSFYMFNRRVSSWSIKRGTMGAFIPENICNMDESPLALFGDQSKRSINDIGTSNEINGSRSKIKLTAKQKRILCTRLVSTAWIRTQKSIDFERAFLGIGYIWVDQSPVSIRTLPGFIFDPSIVTSSTTNDDNNKETEEDDENQLMVEQKTKKEFIFVKYQQQKNETAQSRSVSSKVKFN